MQRVNNIFITNKGKIKLKSGKPQRPSKKKREGQMEGVRGEDGKQVKPEGGIAPPPGDYQVAKEVKAESKEPQLRAMLVLVIVWMVSSARPPRVSATR